MPRIRPRWLFPEEIDKVEDMVEGWGDQGHCHIKVIKEGELKNHNQEKDPQEDALYHQYLYSRVQKLILTFKTFL